MRKSDTLDILASDAHFRSCSNRTNECPVQYVACSGKADFIALNACHLHRQTLISNAFLIAHALCASIWRDGSNCTAHQPRRQKRDYETHRAIRWSASFDSSSVIKMAAVKETPHLTPRRPDAVLYP